MKLVYLFIYLFVTDYNQESNFKGGIFGLYGDYSLYTELKLNEDMTFLFNHRVLNGISYNNIKGMWKVKKNKILLFNYPVKEKIPNKYYLDGTKLCIESKKNNKFPTYLKKVTETD